jgi:hypothetical protein
VWLGDPQAEIAMHDLDGFAEVVAGGVPARVWHELMVGVLAGRLGAQPSGPSRTPAGNGARVPQ